MKQRKKTKAKKQSTDSDSLKWWKKRRSDIKAEIGKGLDMRQTVTVNIGRPAAPGTFTLEAYHNDFPMPLAVIWFGVVGLSQIQINNIYTFEPLRRCGLMSLLQETILRWYPGRSLVTGAGTKLGKAWMLANGWKETKAGWEFSQ